MLTPDNYDLIIFHTEADVIIAKRHTIDSLRIIMIGRTRIEGKCLV